MFNNLLNFGDFSDLYYRIRQRGLAFIHKKLRINKNKRTINTFNESDKTSANFWDIPKVNERLNFKITSNPNLEYPDYVYERYLKEKSDLKLLSVGCGTGSYEIKFAKYPNFAEIHGIDIAPKLIAYANEQAERLNYHTLSYSVNNINEMELSNNQYDVILFHSSLHHLNNLDFLLGDKIKNTLNDGGILIINEYVGPNRFQFPKYQIDAINKILNEIPEQYRKILSTDNIKTKVRAPGRIRMYISDPSEAIESETILNTLHQYFEILEEKPLGNNILMLLLKDIAHNFFEDNEDTNNLLELIFNYEDEYLKSHPSDFIFGVYKK
jgi:2-polyprenyl-3-methyl-5-hydroxy-6-metoxy-1,4-benzoquinol methylase